MFWIGGASLIWIGVGVVLMDGGAQANHLTNQTVIFGLSPEERSRVNSIYMVGYFLGGALGTAVAAGLAARGVAGGLRGWWDCGDLGDSGPSEVCLRATRAVRRCRREGEARGPFSGGGMRAPTSPDTSRSMLRENAREPHVACTDAGDGVDR